jgi:hypothetical protein
MTGGLYGESTYLHPFFDIVKQKGQMNKQSFLPIIFYSSAKGRIPMHLINIKEGVFYAM